MIRRAVLLSLALVALLAAPVAAQSGDDYDGAGGTAVAGDDSIRVTGEGCPPNADIAYTYEGPEDGSGTAQADAEGDFDFTIEGLAPGDYTVTVECGGETFVLNATVGGTTGGTTATTTGAAGALPTTGSDSSLPMAQVGIALVMAGGVAVYIARRRRNTAFTD